MCSYVQQPWTLNENNEMSQFCWVPIYVGEIEYCVNWMSHPQRVESGEYGVMVELYSHSGFESKIGLFLTVVGLTVNLLKGSLGWNGQSIVTD